MLLSLADDIVVAALSVWPTGHQRALIGEIPSFMYLLRLHSHVWLLHQPDYSRLDQITSRLGGSKIYKITPFVNSILEHCRVSRHTS